MPDEMQKRFRTAKALDFEFTMQYNRESLNLSKNRAFAYTNALFLYVYIVFILYNKHCGKNLGVNHKNNMLLYKLVY